MSDTDKSTRLLKVAKELNIGTATVTEYLAKKGFSGRKQAYGQDHR